MSTPLRTPCRKCGGTQATYSQSGPHLKASCASCGAYCYFVPKAEQEELRTAITILLRRVEDGFFAGTRHLDFADSLASVWREKGTLSPAQWGWVLQLSKFEVKS